MGSETPVFLMLALTLCVALLGPGMITIEDTRVKEPRQTQETSDIMQQD